MSDTEIVKALEERMTKAIVYEERLTVTQEELDALLVVRVKAETFDKFIGVTNEA